VILEIVKQMSDSLVLDEAVAGLVKNVHRLVEFDSAALYVPAEGALTTRYADGKFTAYLHSQEVPFGEGVVGLAAKTQKPVLNESPTVEFGFPSYGPGSKSLGSALAVPLEGRAGLAGVFMLCRHEKGAFTKDNVRILQSVTATLGFVVENALRYEQATSSASTDYLTGLPNARALTQHLETEIMRSERQGSGLVVLVTDLDGFKAVNDRFGHLEGNRVLCSVAKALRQSCREYDYVGRLGGDEFVMILPGLGEKDVRRRITALDEAVRRAAREVCPDAMIGLSAGTARCWEDGATAPTLLAAADERMYQAKAMRKARATGGSVGFDFDFARSAQQ
jgi:diguanylate cyclase (GGDEF)-like protein